MKELNIGDVILMERKALGLTQEALAGFMGVSKASVSKWETGTSYPDVVLLPQLAAYFDISLDELMGYEPQLTDEGIREVYVTLVSNLADKSIDEAVNHCIDIAKKYYSCYPLLFQVGILLMNYGGGIPKHKDDKRKKSILTEARNLFIRIKDRCKSVELERMALQSEGLCELMMENPDKAVELLKDEKHIAMQLSASAILALSYKELGRNKVAKMVLQESIIDSVIILLYDISSYISIGEDDIEHFEKAYQRAKSLDQTFNIRHIFPVAMLSFYLYASEGYLNLGDTDKALDILDSYAEIATGDIYPVAVRSDDFFTLVSEIKEKDMKENPCIMSESHGSEVSTKENIANGVIANPKFERLTDEPRFKSLVAKLESLLS